MSGLLGNQLVLFSKGSQKKQNCFSGDLTFSVYCDILLIMTC